MRATSGSGVRGHMQAPCGDGGAVERQASHVPRTHPIASGTHTGTNPAPNPTAPLPRTRPLRLLLPLRPGMRRAARSGGLQQPLAECRPTGRDAAPGRGVAVATAAAAERARAGTPTASESAAGRAAERGAHAVPGGVRRDELTGCVADGGGLGSRARRDGCRLGGGACSHASACAAARTAARASACASARTSACASRSRARDERAASRSSPGLRARKCAGPGTLNAVVAVACM